MFSGKEWADAKQAEQDLPVYIRPAGSDNERLSDTEQGCTGRRLLVFFVCNAAAQSCHLAASQRRVRTGLYLSLIHI